MVPAAYARVPCLRAWLACCDSVRGVLLWLLLLQPLMDAAARADTSGVLLARQGQPLVLAGGCLGDDEVRLGRARTRVTGLLLPHALSSFGAARPDQLRHFGPGWQADDTRGDDKGHDAPPDGCHAAIVRLAPPRTREGRGCGERTMADAPTLTHPALERPFTPLVRVQAGGP